jgi:hypothetical protein
LQSETSFSKTSGWGMKEVLGAGSWVLRLGLYNLAPST